MQEDILEVVIVKENCEIKPLIAVISMKNSLGLHEIYMQKVEMVMMRSKLLRNNLMARKFIKRQ